MAKSVKAIPKKKRGRPKSAGQGLGIMVRGHVDFLEPLDASISQQTPPPSRPEAIRRLVELGLTVKSKDRSASEGQKLRAREMAGNAIDKMSDDHASAVDQASRKRRLLKGPEEFRDDRVDRPKAKKK